MAFAHPAGNDNEVQRIAVEPFAGGVDAGGRLMGRLVMDRRVFDSVGVEVEVRKRQECGVAIGGKHLHHRRQSNQIFVNGRLWQPSNVIKLSHRYFLKMGDKA